MGKLSAVLCLSLMALPAAAGESPTLDELHNNGVINPSTMDKDNDGNRIEGTGEVYPESAYTLTRVDTAGTNTITKYEYNEETQKFEPVYYELTLKQTEYGEGGNSKYFEWEQNSEGNYEFKEVSTPSGGKTTITAHYDTNYGRIDTDQQGKDIVGDFVGNYIQSDSGDAYGGAIYNTRTIGDITGDFIGNYAQSESDYVYGGAIYNTRTIGDITGDFIGNYAQSDSDGAMGGAIYNYYTIGNITGDFIGNYASGSSYARGGAIYNYRGYIGNITGNFIGNYAQGDSARGGAIFNNNSKYKISRIGNITGDFIGNYVQSDSNDASGGAIYNCYKSSEIGNITGDFIGNYAQSDSSEACGGAIFNDENSSIDNIAGDFVGNYAQGIYASGGAIFNADGNIGGIIGDFIGNYTQGDSYVDGGAIYNLGGTISYITGDFVGNYAQGDSDSANGGAIYNKYGTIGYITGDFISNYVQNNGSNSYNALASGGAIFNDDGIIGNITGDFIGNYVQSNSSVAMGGAINNYYTIGNITGDFICNFAQSDSLVVVGGAIGNNGTIGNITGDFIGNYAQGDSTVLGGAIFNNGKIEGVRPSVGPQAMFLNETPDSTPRGIINSSFYNNYAKSANGEAKGGAIFTVTDLNIIADNGQSVFSGNYTESRGVKDENSIYVSNPGAMAGSLSPETYDSPDISEDSLADKFYNSYNSGSRLVLGSYNSGLIRFDDKIDGDEGYLVRITGDKTSKVVLNNNVDNAAVLLDTVTLNLGKNDVFENSNVIMTSGHLSLLNNAAETQIMQSANLAGHIGMSVDVDLKNAQMDRLPDNIVIVSEQESGTASKIDVEYLNLLNDADKDRTDILFANDNYKDIVSYTGKNPVAYSPIYKYDVSYNPNDGFFTFLRGSSSNPSDNFNPTVLSTPVTSQAGAYATQMQTFNYAFQHAENFMNLPLFERIALKESGRYATLNTVDSGVYSPLLTRVEQAGFWVKPYVSFENIPLKNGPEVTNIAYGSLIGFDSSMKPIKHGFDRVLTGYVGYNGASQSYSGVDSYQNGGLIGGTMTLYKNNFFNATTISAGASVGESYNMYGHDNFTMFLAGIANKLGYNFEFKNGRYIIQPSLMMSYTFVNTFDYTNAAGVDINSDPMHAIQLSPGVKFIMNTKNGWQPYVGVNMVWNVMDTQKVTANDVRLPEMSIKPYVQYGLGLQKKIKDKFLAFGQAMVSNGGRNGISLSFGLRWFIGRE